MGTFNKNATTPINSANKTATVWGADNTSYMFSSMVHRYTMPSLGSGGREIISCKVVVRGTKSGVGTYGTMEAYCTNNPNLLPNQYTTTTKLGSLYQAWYGPIHANDYTGDNDFPITSNLATLSGYSGTWYLILNFTSSITFEAYGLGTRLVGEYRDTTMRCIVSGTERLAEPYVNIGGTYRRADAFTNIGGTYRAGT